MLKAFEELRTKADEVWQATHARTVIRVPVATCSIAAGVNDTLDVLTALVKERGLDVDVITVGERGLCWLEPLIEVCKPPANGTSASAILYEKVTSDKVDKLLSDAIDGVCLDLAFAVVTGPDVEGVQRLDDFDLWALQERRLLARCGIIDPDNVDHYIAQGGYAGLANAMDQSQVEVI